MFNFSTRKVGGLRFIKLGRFTLSFSISRAYKPMKRPLSAVERLRRGNLIQPLTFDHTMRRYLTVADMEG